MPLLADWVFLTLVDEYGDGAGDRRTGTATGTRPTCAQFAALHVLHLPPASPSRRSMATARPVLVEDLTPTCWRGCSRTRAPGGVPAARRQSVLTVPMVARRRTLGALALVLVRRPARFTQDDVDLAEDLARRAALAMDNVRLYQRSTPSPTRCSARCCPSSPRSPGIEAAAHYVSASTRGRRRRRLLRPAARCPTARSASWSATWSATTSPPPPRWGTCAGCCAPASGTPRTPTPARSWPGSTGWCRACGWPRWRRWSTPAPCRPAAAGEPWRLHVANAGHPPLLLRSPDGEVRLLDGVTGHAGRRRRRQPPRRRVVLEVPAGSTLIAYTDGLIERPGQRHGPGHRASCASGWPPRPLGADPRELCDAAVSGALDHRDDVALLAVRFG